MKTKRNKIQTVPIETLIDNPNNPNRMSKTTFAKLVRNIERTGLYEPIIVRKSNNSQNSERGTQYEIINGHHRVRALKQLGYTKVDVCVWDADDRQTDILLGTLNRLSGSDILEKKLTLINRLNSKMQSKELSELLPLTSGQIERYCSLEFPKAPAKADSENIPHPLIFFVSKEQKKIIEDAISKARKNTKNSKKTKADAIAQIAGSFDKNKGW
jgi:ParB/RepB/Spo0J family partition protein